MFRPVNIPSPVFGPGYLLGAKGEAGGAYFPTLDFSSGTLPSGGTYEVTYARTGTAWHWVTDTPLPMLESVAEDVARFSVNPPGARSDRVADSMGLMFEPTRQNILTYGRGAATQWTSTNITPTTANEGFYATGTSRILTATADNGIHYRTTPPASSTAQWCFSAWVKRKTGYGKVYLTLKSGVEYDISAALANYYVDGSNVRQSAWSRVYLAIPGQGPWYGDINTCDRIGFRIATSGDAIAVDAIQLEAGAYPTSEILNSTTDLNIRNADRILIDINVGGTPTRYLLDADSWEADTSVSALLWRIRQERHIKCITLQPNGSDWDIDILTPAENRVNMGWHDGAPSPVIYEISQPDLTPQSTYVFQVGYLIEAATFGNVSLGGTFNNFTDHAGNRLTDNSSNYLGVN